MSATTSNRGYPYPQSTDDFRPYEDIQALAEAVDVDVAALVAATTPVTVTGATVGSVSAGFTVNSATARTLAGGKLVYIRLDLNSTNAITSSGGNITDTTCFTVASAYRPTEITSAIFTGNPGTGEVQLGFDGLVVLRTADVSIAAGKDLRMNFCFIKDA